MVAVHARPEDDPVVAGDAACIVYHSLEHSNIALDMKTVVDDDRLVVAEDSVHGA